MERLNEKLCVVGGGLVGSLLSLFLAQRGYQVDLFERRSDLRRGNQARGRSINLAISARGLHALDQVGLKERVMDRVIPMQGRLIHSLRGELTFQPYSAKSEERIFSLSRSELNQILIDAAEDTQRVQFHFDRTLTEVDLVTGQLSFRDEVNGLMTHQEYSRIFATDGASSIIRDRIAMSEKGLAQKARLEYGYKEITLPAGPSGSHLLERSALHIWPRGNYMLIALPNLDGSFTCTLFLPYEGPVSFAALTQEAHVMGFFRNNFPDVLPLIPNLLEEFTENPVGTMVTVKTSPWNFKSRALLMGDAAHAIVPFFGQGMNCGFEDCTLLEKLMSRGLNLDQIFEKFTELRKPDTDSIADMAVENFVEMRDKVQNPRFLLEKEAEKILQTNFPDQYISRYSLVSFSRVPYRLAYEAGLVETEILAELCASLEDPEKLDLTRAAELIRLKLDPVLKRGFEHGP